MMKTEFVYTGHTIREFDRIAIQAFDIAGYTLMTRAGTYLFKCLLDRWPEAHAITLFCGAGNNAGDAYVVARLALIEGWTVRLISLTNPSQLKGDALMACQAYQAVGGEIEQWSDTSGMQSLCTDIVIDGLLGTGLNIKRPVSGLFADVIEGLNRLCSKLGIPVVAIDIPSGLQADTGQVVGVAIKAMMTVTFIGMKLGLLTGQACHYCGEIRFSDLAIPAAVYDAVEALPIEWLHSASMMTLLPLRLCSSHKGHHGHALMVGGSVGMQGAIQLASDAALRVGAGLVTVGTAVEHSDGLNVARPELMVQGLTSSADLQALLLNPHKRFNVIAIGPGLGQHHWSRALLTLVLNQQALKVLDADALNLLAKTSMRRDDWVLTPHPAEAARLLACDVATVERDRLAAVQRLQKIYGGVVVLKGAGSLIASERAVSICIEGNAGMASGGMGDVLTGIIAGLLAQGLGLYDAARCGVWVHAYAADCAVQEEGERGLLASDVIAYVRRVVNGKGV